MYTINCCIFLTWYQILFYLFYVFDFEYSGGENILCNKLYGKLDLYIKASRISCNDSLARVVLFFRLTKVIK